MHQELLQDDQKLARNVNLCLAIWTSFDLLKPLALGSEHVLLEIVEHDDELVLIKGVCDTLAFIFPPLVALREQERVAKEVLEDAFEGASLIDLRVLGHKHVLHGVGVGDEHLHTAQVHQSFVVLRVVKLLRL